LVRVAGAVNGIPSEAVPEPVERRTWLVFLFPLRFLGASRHEMDAPGEPARYLVALGTADGSITLALEVPTDEAAGVRRAWLAETEADAAVRLAAARASRIILAHACSLVRHGDADSRPPRPPTSR
jgi:hypothetical protein